MQDNISSLFGLFQIKIKLILSCRTPVKLMRYSLITSPLDMQIVPWSDC